MSLRSPTTTPRPTTTPLSPPTTSTLPPPTTMSQPSHPHADLSEDLSLAEEEYASMSESLREILSQPAFPSSASLNLPSRDDIRQDHYGHIPSQQSGSLSVPFACDTSRAHFHSSHSSYSTTPPRSSSQELEQLLLALQQASTDSSGSTSMSTQTPRISHVGLIMSSSSASNDMDVTPDYSSASRYQFASSFVQQPPPM